MKLHLDIIHLHSTSSSGIHVDTLSFYSGLIAGMIEEQESTEQKGGALQGQCVMGGHTEEMSRALAEARATDPTAHAARMEPHMKARPGVRSGKSW